MTETVLPFFWNLFGLFALEKTGTTLDSRSRCLLSTPMKQNRVDVYFNEVYTIGEVIDMNHQIKTIRQNVGLTQKELSNRVGVPVNTIRNWEQELRKPSEWTLNLLIDRILRERTETLSPVDESRGVLSFLTIKRTVCQIASQYDVKRIVLFGSYAKGEATPESDIDLYMESDLYGLDYFGFVEALREGLNKKVEVLSDKTVEKSSEIDREIKRTGVLIYER